MSQSTQTILIIGGLAIAGFIAYKFISGRSGGGTSQPSPTGNPTSPPWWEGILGTGEQAGGTYLTGLLGGGTGTGGGGGGLLG